MVTANLNPSLMVGQTNNTLTCDVSGTDRLNPAIAYQWTRNGETVPDIDGSSETLTLPTIALSSAGEYVCNVTVSSNLLNSDVSSTGTSQRVEIQSELINQSDTCDIHTPFQQFQLHSLSLSLVVVVMLLAVDPLSP